MNFEGLPNDLIAEVIGWLPLNSVAICLRVSKRIVKKSHLFFFFL